MKKYIWIFLIAAPILAFGLAGIKYYYSIQIWTYDGPDVVFEVQPGEGFSKINGRLASMNLISSAKIFHRYSQINGLMTKFKAGRYNIKSNSNMLEIIDTLVKGQSITVPITIPEGKNLFEIGALLEENGIVSKENFVRAAKDAAFTKSLGIPASRIEGYLYPETYNFIPKSMAKNVVKTMYSVFKQKTEDLDLNNNPLGLSPHSVIILASIVEKETGAAHERPMIAGVFMNRLKKRMRLQSDPTTIYGIYEEYDGNLRKKHLLQRTEYNTYKINGLPIGPISNPGINSIKAVLSPADHKFLYFVSVNDGTHVFSETYKQHIQAVNKYQKDWRMRQGKSWRDLNKK